MIKLFIAIKLDGNSNMNIYASPVNACDICGNLFGDSLGESRIMYDAKIPGGSWGNFCPSCFDDLNCKVGNGKGQKYELQALDGSMAWVKVEG